MVHDAATTARNTVTAAVTQLLLDTERQQHLKIREMARRLSALTNLRKYALEEVPRWRTHGGDFLYAQPYNDALIFGDAAGAAFTELSQPSPGGRQAPRSTRSRCAASCAGAAGDSEPDRCGGHRRHRRQRPAPPARTQERNCQAIDALERDVIDPSRDQSTTAVLDKISGAALIGARQRQARLQLLVGMVEQLLVESKRARDTETAALAMQMVTWRDGRAAADAFVAGSG